MPGSPRDTGFGSVEQVPSVAMTRGDSGAVSPGVAALHDVDALLRDGVEYVGSQNEIAGSSCSSNSKDENTVGDASSLAGIAELPGMKLDVLDNQSIFRMFALLTFVFVYSLCIMIYLIINYTNEAFRSSRAGYITFYAHAILPALILGFFTILFIQRNGVDIARKKRSDLSYLQKDRVYTDLSTTAAYVLYFELLARPGYSLTYVFSGLIDYAKKGSVANEEDLFRATGSYNNTPSDNFQTAIFFGLYLCMRLFVLRNGAGDALYMANRFEARHTANTSANLPDTFSDVQAPKCAADFKADLDMLLLGEEEDEDEEEKDKRRSITQHDSLATRLVHGLCCSSRRKGQCCFGVRPFSYYQDKFMGRASSKALKSLGTHPFPMDWISVMIYWYWVNIDVASTLVVYYATFSSVSTSLEFQPAIVPFSSIIPLFRVCLENDENGYLRCSYSSSQRAFWRAIASTLLLLIEFFLAFLVFRALRGVRGKMRKPPYHHIRDHWLSYTWTVSISGATWTMVYFLAFIFVVSIPAGYWTHEYLPQANGTLVLNIDPLYRVGVTSSSLCYLSINLVIGVEVFFMMYTSLPPDSKGLWGWVGPPEWKPRLCCRKEQSGSADGSDVGVFADNFFEENPVFFTSEQELKFMKRRIRGSNLSRRQSSFLPPFAKVGIASFSPKTQLEPAFLDTSTQIRSNVVVLESEVLSYNMSTAVYLVSAKGNNIDTKRELIEGKEDSNDRARKQLKYVAHVHDDDTDTHVLVVLAPGKVLVSFRGTVSAKNVKTDLDAALVPHEMAQQIPTEEIMHLFEDSQENVLQVRRLQVALQEVPKVHKGFLIAYRAVSDKLFDLIWPMLCTDGVQKRALTVSGHSLGGGLAGLCAFDFALRLRTMLAQTSDNKKARPVVSLSTFGCPRFCNFSWKARFDSIISHARRFVLAKDPIPQTPPQLVLSIVNPFKCWQHVGTFLLLDLAGNFLINPTAVERMLVHGFHRPSKSRHFMTRYGLALLLSAARLKQAEEIGLWDNHVRRFCSLGRKDIIACPDAVLRHIYFVVFQAGVKSNALDSRYREFYHAMNYVTKRIGDQFNNHSLQAIASAQGSRALSNGLADVENFGSLTFIQEEATARQTHDGIQLETVAATQNQDPTEPKPNPKDVHLTVL